MAFLKGKIHGKIKGSTLLEALVAMIIIVLCTGVATTVFINVMDSQNNRLKITAAARLQEISESSMTEKKFLDDKIEGDLFTIEKKISKYAGSDNLILFSLKAIDKRGRLLAERKELIITR